MTCRLPKRRPTIICKRPIMICMLVSPARPPRRGFAFGFAWEGAGFGIGAGSYRTRYILKPACRYTCHFYSGALHRAQSFILVCGTYYQSIQSYSLADAATALAGDCQVAFG